MNTLSFTFEPPKIRTGKRKGRYATINNASNWFRYQKTSIKNEFKRYLKDWVVPEREGPVLSVPMTFTFQIIKGNKVKQDADSFSFSYKWFVDFMVENGYIEDDHLVTFVLKPAKYEKNTVGTMVYAEMEPTKDH